MSYSRQNSVIFLSVPETLRGQMEGGFSINPDIPLPVEAPSENEKLNLEELSWEMIISGMLRVISRAEVKEEWIRYYRGFVLAMRPSIMNEFTEAAILKARNGDFDLALEIMESLKGLFPRSPVVLLNRALVLEERAAALGKRLEKQPEQQAGALREAEEAYAEALSLQPPFPDALFNAGFFYMERKEFRRAKDCFLHFLETADNAENPAFKEKIEKAWAVIKDIGKNGLEDEGLSEAYKLINEGSEEAGMSGIRNFIEAHPSVWNGWFMLGWALRRLCRWQDAAAALGKAKECGGANSDTRNELAICLMEMGDLSASRRELEAALHDEPENIKVISNLGVLALKSGNKNEAAAFFRTVLELDPDDPVAQKYA